MRKLTLNVEKQQKEVRKTGQKSSKKGSSNKGGTSFSKGVLDAKPFVIKAPEKGNVGPSSKTTGSLQFNLKNCFKCQGYGYIAFDCPNSQHYFYFGGKTVNEEDLPNE